MGESDLPPIYDYEQVINRPQVVKTYPVPDPTGEVRQEVKRVLGAVRDDSTKNRVELVPPEWLWALGEVCTQGAVKYAPRNWEKGFLWSRLWGPMLRHAFKFMCGERYDPETGCHHMAMVAWNALALMTHDIRGLGEDDMPKLDINLLSKVRKDAPSS